jgi:NADH-quinone oxidoreductase subunit G
MTTTTSEPKKAPPDAPAAAAAPAPAPAPPKDTVTLTIDGQSVTVKKGTLLVEAAKLLDGSSSDTDIPVFCYHDKLKPVGACRMCLVDIEKMPRLQTACTTPVGEGMIVRTKSDKAVEGQNAVVTLLLANHPLDCPVCDKGGECPLQDNTFEHGLGTTRFEEEKREKDKAFELSERIVLDRERCILCYRCVRFHEEIPGDRALAVLDRGSRGEIGVAVGERYTSPVQGNVIDICPVGALTSRQYRFRSRPWDLRRAKGVAKDDPTGTNVWIDSRDGRVLRLRPRENLTINDAWLADATRFDTIPQERTSRLQTPLVRKNGRLTAATWFEAMRVASNMIRHHKAGVLCSTTVSNEALAVVKAGGIVAAAKAAAWPSLSEVTPTGTLLALQQSKSVVVVGCDPFHQAPIVGLMIRRALVPTTDGGISRGGGGTLVVIGAENGLFRDTAAWLKCDEANTVKVMQDLCAALEGGGSAEAKTAAALLKDRPASLIVGPDVVRSDAGRAAYERLQDLLGKDDGFSGVLEGAGNVGGARAILGDTDAAAVIDDATDTLIVVGDTPHQPDLNVPKTSARVVWATSSLGTDLSAVPDNVDVVLPLADTYEQAGSFTSIDGIHQGFDAGGIPPGVGTEKAKADWECLALLSSELGASMPKDLKGLRAVFASTYAFGRLPHNKNVPPLSLNVM